MKKLLLLLVLLSSTLVARAQLSTSVTTSGFCQGTATPVSVAFTDAITSYQPGNVFTAQLSDAAGSFAAPVVIGTLASASATGAVAAVVPSSITTGTGYRIRVVASDPATVGADNGIDLIIVPPPSVTATATTPVCLGTNVLLSASVIPGATYSWAGPNSFTSTIFNPIVPNVQLSSGGTYYVLVTSNGCIVEDTVHVTVNPLTAQPVPSSNAPLCAGQTLQLYSSGPPMGPNVTYSWTGPNNWTSTIQNPEIQNVTTAAQGIYYVTTFVNGCPSPAGVIQVTINPAPQANAGSDQVGLCPSTTTTLAASTPALGSGVWSVASGTGGTIQNPSQANSSFSGQLNQSYQLVWTVFATGCTPATDTVLIDFMSSVPAPAILSNNSPICEGQTLQLTAAPEPGATYTWTGPLGTYYGQALFTTNATPAHSGLYTLQTTHPGGCQSQSTIVNAPVIGSSTTPMFTNNSPLCAGQTLILSANIPSATYTWSGPNGFSSNLQQPTIPNVTTAYSGNYTLTVGLNNCTSQASVQQVQVLPAVPQPGVSSNSPICQGGALLLSATTTVANAAFSWSGPNNFSSAQQNPQISNATTSHAGTYTVYGLANGCTSPAGTVTAIVYPAPAVPVLSNNGPICEGTTLQLSVTNPVGGAMYTWYTPANGFVATGTTHTISNATLADASTYQVSVVGPFGCIQNILGSTTVVIFALPVVTASSNSPICQGATLQFSATSVPGANYSWSGPNSFTSTQPNPIIANAQPSVHSGTYQLFVTRNGCTIDIATTTSVLSPTSIQAHSNSPVPPSGTLFLSASNSVAVNQVVSWSGPNGFSATGSTVYLQNVTAANAGVYTATLPINSCGGGGSSSTTVQVVPLNTISGLVYADVNNNGLQDAGELPLSNMVVVLQPGNIVANTNSLGEFTLYAPDGNYTLTLTAPNPQQTVSPASYSLNPVGLNQVLTGNNFGVYTPPAPDFVASLTTGSTPPIPGFTFTYYPKIINAGNTAASGQARTVLPAGLTLITATTGATISGDTLTWNFTNLAPGQQLNYMVSLQVPVGTALGSTVHLQAIADPVANDVTPANNIASLYKTVVGSFDPNDKAVSPPGPITPTQVAAGQELVYKIRFQNTGTYLAFNILVADTLSSLLDVSTFKMQSTSHNCNVTLREQGILEFFFPNIMLPDSNSNEPLSHGYIQYSIKPKTTLALGDDIQNTAHIFFDFNEAIVTNTTSTIVALPNGFAEAKEENPLQVFPNPNNGNATVRFTAENPAETTVSVLNLLGQEVQRLVQQTTAGEVEIAVDLQNQPAGIYLLQVRQGEKVFTAKLVRQ